ncbi:MAG: DNRLRE domain-containing protein [Cytophagales bacterium]|nr:DNRLRE domain-containing protein [Cytophagales bacterium]
MRTLYSISLLALLLAWRAGASPAQAQTYALPDMRKTNSGTVVTTAKQWETQRRGELLKLFEDHIYGQVPQQYDAIKFTTTHEPNALQGAATIKQVSIQVFRGGKFVTIHLKLVIPNKVRRPGVFLLINHRNASNIDPFRTTESPFWPFKTVVEKGYAMAAFHVGDVAPDAIAYYADEVISKLYPEQQQLTNGMKALGAWGWGASRVMDYLRTDPDIDFSKVALVGHSRGGKAALWCGAQDKRFAVTISNESGRGGAALFRDGDPNDPNDPNDSYDDSETVDLIKRNFPHWFNSYFNNTYTTLNIGTLPVDQHELMALMAPRPVYVASAAGDEWSDPQGEFFGIKNAQPAYGLYGIGMPAQFSSSSLPPVGTTVTKSFMGYHLRSGEHDMLTEDWLRFVDFADYHFRDRVSAEADSHVRDGATASQNFGGASTLELKTSSATNDGYNRNAFLRFNLTGYASIATARLRFYVSQGGSATASSPVISTNVHSVANTAWTESGISWANQPTLGKTLGSFTVTGGHSGAWVEVDVTAYVKAEKNAGRNTVSFGLKNATTSSTTVQIHSREAAFNQPQLIITPAVVYEAEEALLSGGTKVAANFPGYSGSGFADYVNARKEAITWHIAAAAAGSYQLDFRYALASGSLSLRVEVNGAVVASSLAFAATGGWHLWSFAGVRASLVAGTNTVRLTSIGSGGPNLDLLSVSPATPTTGRLAATENAGHEAIPESSPLQVYPNPARRAVTLVSEQELVSVQLLSSLGVICDVHAQLRDKQVVIPVSHLPAGIYTIRAQTAQGKYISKQVIIMH